MEEDELLFQAEFDVFKRVGFGDEVIKSERIYRDPAQKFYVFVDAIARKLNSEKIISFSENTIKYILKKIDNVPNVRYKNPTAYILGYSVIKNNQIDKKLFQNLKPYLNNLDFPMKQTDIIRYANLWLTQLI